MHRLRWKDVERRCWRSHSQILCHIRFIDIYESCDVCGNGLVVYI